MHSPISELSCYISLMTRMRSAAKWAQLLHNHYLPNVGQEQEAMGHESLTVPSWLIFFFPTVHFLQCFKRLTSMAVLMPVILSPNPCHKGVSRNFKDFAIQEVKTKCFYLQAFYCCCLFCIKHLETIPVSGLLWSCISVLFFLNSIKYDYDTGTIFWIFL